MTDWHIWIIIGILLIIVEMMSFTGFAACFSVAAFITSLAAWSGMALTWQLGIFALGSALCMTVVPSVFRRIYRHSENKPILTVGLVGQLGQVVDAILPHGSGRVKLGGEEWRALTRDGAGLPEGARVEITGVEGATLTVKHRQDLAIP